MFHSRLIIDEVMRFKILPPSWKLVLTLTGREARLQEAKGFLTSIDQNGVRNCIGRRWMNW
jgi:hypothetical protein